MSDRVFLKSPITTTMFVTSALTGRVVLKSAILKTKLKFKGSLTTRVVLSSAIDVEDVQ